MANKWRRRSENCPHSLSTLGKVTDLTSLETASAAATAPSMLPETVIPAVPKASESPGLPSQTSD